MRLGTRLLLPLLAAVAAVMTLFAVWALHQRQTTLSSEARRETHAYATVLGLALERAMRDPDHGDAQQIIDRLTRQPEIYGVVVYDSRARVRLASDPRLVAARDPALVRPALEGTPVAVEREIDSQRVYALLSPLYGPSGVIGAFEVAQPLSFVEAEQARTRQRFLLNTLALVAAVTTIMLVLVRRTITSPLERLVSAVRALGRGELSHRVPQEGTGELTALAEEFNRMADHLEQARIELLRETEERVSLEQRLRRSEQLAAVGKLAAGLAHEIAAPLSVVAGRAEMLRRREVEPEARERHLRIIVDQIGRITLIVRNLLDFSRRREPQLRPHDLGSVLQSVTAFLEGEFERAGVRVEREGPATAWVRGDPHLLHQVLLNLLMNAVHSLEGAEEKRIVLRVVDSSPVVVEVEDTGGGVPEEILPRIFEPFFTTKSGGEGTGLGLAVAREIVQEHEGTLDVRNGDHGAVFRLSLPAAAVPVHA